jgi:serine/threonine protein kinase/tetratricopeptide (TPR) repeat protein
MAIEPGTRLGPYEILAGIGAGGMGEVYRARDTRLVREVAVKVLPARLARDPKALARFDREAKAIASLSHPNILAVFDVGSAGDIHYVVTELLEGETLRARLRRAPLEWREAAEIGAALADGLAAAHSKSIIHCDLKPENVFLAQGGWVKILDFGLARTLPRPAGDSTLTMEVGDLNSFQGTVGYISPEQLRGSAAGTRSDLFALGCVLYEMVARRRAFPGKSSAEVFAGILHEAPAPLSAPVPESLERLILRCLEKLPEGRFGSAADVAASLRAALMEPAGSRHSRSIAVLPFVNASGDPDADYLSDGIAESIMNSLAQLSQLKVAPRSSVFRYKGQDAEPQKIGRELGVRVVLTGRVTQTGGSLIVRTELTDADEGKQLWGERYRRKVADIFDIEEDIAKRISASLRLKLTGTEQKRLTKRFTEDSEAYRLYLRGRFFWIKRTPEGMRQGAEFFQQAIAKDPAYALAFAGLADCYSVLTTYLAFTPREGWARAKAAAAAAVALDPDLAEAHASWGYIRFFGDWDWEAAEAEFRRASEISPSYWMNHGWYSYVLAAWGRFGEAEQEINRARELEPLSPLVAYLSAGVATLARNYTEAEQRCLQGLEIDPDYPLLHLWLGMVYERQTRYPEAISELETAARLLGDAPLAAGSLAHAYALAGRRKEAQRILSDLLKQARGKITDSYYIALIHAGLGDVDEAFAWLNRAAEHRGAGTAALMIQSDPRIDELRSDARFGQILERMGLQALKAASSSGPL